MTGLKFYMTRTFGRSRKMLRVLLLRVHDRGEKTSIITCGSAREKRETLAIFETVIVLYQRNEQSSLFLIWIIQELINKTGTPTSKQNHVTSYHRPNINGPANPHPQYYS
jgi:hypothetical protein